MGSKLPFKKAENPVQSSGIKKRSKARKINLDEDNNNSYNLIDFDYKRFESRKRKAKQRELLTDELIEKEHELDKNRKIAKRSKILKEKLSHKAAADFRSNSEEALDIRCEENKECDPEIINYIEIYIRENNKFAKSYQLMKDIYEKYENLYKDQENFDKSRYNIPQSNEVCAILVSDANDEIPPSNIVVYPREPMCYPLLYPRSTFGYSFNLKDSLGKKVSLCDYVNGAEIQKKVILPSTFCGGPRSMHEHFMDAMTIVNETGKPDLFITFTCNPSDPDILKCLFPGQTASDRPDII
uniref:Helitron helicase-like domain-containing protein n=1 Tax=Meloidogyne javanica TaxID=6303 RepID=A0A915LDF1_MELJA